MAIRSLLLSLTLTGFLGYSFTVGLTDPNSLLKKIPEWVTLALLVIFFFLYLLATWWAFKGFSDHKITAILSMGFCAFGLGLYALAFTMELGKEGQHRGSMITISQRSTSPKKPLWPKLHTRLDWGWRTPFLPNTGPWLKPTML